ncbi:NAD(P)H-binding protein [Lysobacter maris]|uniref:NAD(P)H-binding protein n=1 Tax=Marilutibacter maris TaxID=1605891 RepID=A0A507ZU61_9GAMM|nr:NAD(P)-binding oxidoreductase [Lysobacter maris]KAB8165370.1 NAD(P)H-binding protein [Lysobacter maris]
MTVLVAGASGATGRLLVDILLGHGRRVRAIVRSPARLPASLREHPRLSIVHADLLDLDEEAMARQVEDCTAIVSCLGHNPTLRGLFGPPRRLVTEATSRLCEAVRRCRPERPVRFVLMNTAGNRNRGIAEPVALGERLAVGLIRLLLPPHRDNEDAAAWLQARFGPGDTAIEWVVVRPDSLTDADRVTAYDVHPSPIRSAIFDPGHTSRINVAHFIGELLADDLAWRRWALRMPVVYDSGAK